MSVRRDTSVPPQADRPEGPVAELPLNEKHLALGLDLGPIAAALKLTPEQVRAAAELLADGNTAPFIARYRPEKTGGLDEAAITAIRERLHQSRVLEKRRTSILRALVGRGLLNEELARQIRAAQSRDELEDLYFPYRRAKRSHASAAQEKHLEPLARRLLDPEQPDEDPRAVAAAFVDAEVAAEKGVTSVDEALAGARTIIAKWISEDRQTRAALRRLYREKGEFHCRVNPDRQQDRYRAYFDWQERLWTAPAHSVLTMRRGEKEGVLSLRVVVPHEEALELILDKFSKGRGRASEQVRLAAQEAFQHLLDPDLAIEMRNWTKERADAEAIRIFAENLRELLLTPPLVGRSVLAFGPRGREPCPVVCLDDQGKVLHHESIVIESRADEAAGAATPKIMALIETYRVGALAVSSGPSGCQLARFLRQLTLPKPGAGDDGDNGANDRNIRDAVALPVLLVQGGGVRVYASSRAARDEFPELDPNVRAVVSIGRRLLDPLAELVKVEPKRLGMGPNQYDVDPRALRRGLVDTVISCVSRVGVDVNTAGRQTLRYVAGLGAEIADEIITYREAHGPLKNLEDLKRVPKLSAKAFEQASGFLRIRDGDNPLDASAIHPERYGLVQQIAVDLGCTVEDLMRDESLRQQVPIKKYLTNDVSLETMRDILNELAHPGCDPRTANGAASGVTSFERLEDLSEGMKLQGIVTNVTDFGAFVDIGGPQDGFVHVSQLADRFVNSPYDVVELGQRISAKVLAVDLQRKRVSLTLREQPDGRRPREDRAADKTPAAAPARAPRANRLNAPGGVGRDGRAPGRERQGKDGKNARPRRGKRQGERRGRGRDHVEKIPDKPVGEGLMAKLLGDWAKKKDGNEQQ